MPSLKDGGAAVDTGSVIFLGLVALLSGFLGYQLSTRHTQRTGQRAWGLAPVVWAAIWACSFLLGGVLFGIATSSRAPGDTWTPEIRIGWILRTLGIVVGTGLGALLVVGGSIGVLGGEPVVTNLVFTIVGVGLFTGGVSLVRTRPRPRPLAERQA